MSGSKIAAENLYRLNGEMADMLEARRAHLRELAHTLISDSPGFDLLLERLHELRDKPIVSADTVEDNRKFVDMGFERVHGLESAELCRLLTESPQFHLKPIDFFGHEEPIALRAHGSIAYIRNAFTDQAFLTFSPLFARPKSQYFDSYQAICEAVSDGNCEACILPIEHAADGKLISFYRMIDRYDLKISACCDIAQTEGVTSRFALLKKNIFISSQSPEEEHLFEFSFTRSSPHPIGTLIETARLSELRVRRIDSIPLAYAENRFAFHLVLSTPGQAKLLPFLLYLALELPQYNPIGIYPCLGE